MMLGAKAEAQKATQDTTPPTAATDRQLYLAMKMLTIGPGRVWWWWLYGGVVVVVWWLNNGCMVFLW